jgi:hypothetical protein
MEATRYRRICRLVDQASPHGRRSRQQFADRVIVKVYFWSTQCDRPVSWACQAANWPAPLLADVIGATLPSQPTMSRRTRTVGVLQLIERVQTMLSERLEDDVVKAIDSKPLKVGSYSRDRDARRGRGAGEKVRGYKLHAITCGKAFKFWTLTGMNSNDQVGAAMLLPKLSDDRAGWGYVTADNGYDANAVHRLAAATNHQLIAPPRASNAQVRDVRRNCPQRIRALDICADPLRHAGVGPSFGLCVLRQRGQIERNFGNATMSGLGAPPPWVRRPHRVATWTAAKLIQRMLRQIEIAGVTM